MQQGCGGPPCKGAVVALEPSTGKILAMVSSPSYDPNLLASHDPEVQAQAWQRLRDNPNNPLANRAISETYPPGSTFKVITTAAALQAGASDTQQLTAASSIPLPNSTATLENYGGEPCGNEPTVSLKQAFALSCNTAFVQLGLLTGADALRSMAHSFGLDSTPNVIPAPGRGINHRGHPRRRRAGHVEHRPKGRRADTAAKRRDRRRPSPTTG